VRVERTHYAATGYEPVCGLEARRPGRMRTFSRHLEDVDCGTCLRVVAVGLVRPVSIRVVPVEGESLYASCYVWPTKRAMYRHRPLERNHEASTTDLDGWVSGRRSPRFAELNFYRGALGVEVVTHEFGHAAHAWARRKRIRLDLDAEERFCYALGAMVRQFYTRAFALELCTPGGHRAE
jgi:hypothetical protein